MLKHITAGRGEGMRHVPRLLMVITGQSHMCVVDVVAQKATLSGFQQHCLPERKTPLLAGLAASNDGVDLPRKQCGNEEPTTAACHHKLPQTVIKKVKCLSRWTWVCPAKFVLWLQ